jgi:aerobic carbon-monoxide dehydrogenase small subunit
MARTQVSTNLNGAETDFLCEPRQSLLEVLRDEIGLTGTKEGCNNGNCGACSVMMNGRVVNACCVLGVEAQGATITTIEGVAQGSQLHPLQQRSSKRRRCSAASAPPASSLRRRRYSTRTPTPMSTRSDSGSRATSAAALATTRSSKPCNVLRTSSRRRNQ